MAGWAISDSDSVCVGRSRSSFSQWRPGRHREACRRAHAVHLPLWVQCMFGIWQLDHPTNVPALSCAVMKNSQSVVYSGRICQRNKLMQVIGKQVPYVLSSVRQDLFESVFHEKCQRGESLKILSSNWIKLGLLLKRGPNITAFLWLSSIFIIENSLDLRPTMWLLCGTLSLQHGSGMLAELARLRAVVGILQPLIFFTFCVTVCFSL